MQPAQYVTKHPFQGDPRQSQLSFPPGATILAKPNQDGAWWWGSYNNKEGWFPPTYVTPVAPAAPGFAPQPNMQQRMQQASFTSAVQQQQMKQQRAQPPPGAFAAAPNVGGSFPGSLPQTRYEPADPFAGLQGMTSSVSSNMTGSTNLISGTVASPSMGGTAAPSPVMTGMSFVGPQVSTPLAVNVGLAAPSKTLSGPQNLVTTPSSGQGHTPRAAGGSPVAPLGGSPSSTLSSADAALARLGITPPSSKPTTPAGSRSSSPVSSLAKTTGTSAKTPAPSARGALPATAKSEESAKYPLPRSPAVAAVTSVSSFAGMGKPKTSAIAPETEAKALRLREEEEARQKEQMRKEREEARKSRGQLPDTASGLGVSGFNLSSASGGDGEVEASLPVASFNPFEYLVGSNKLPERTFSPIFRVPPFWGLMNLNTYIQQKPVPKEKLADRSAMYQQLSKALSFVSHVCALTAQRRVGKGKNPLAFLANNHMACEACIKLISLLPHSAGASGAALDGLFINFINVFVPFLEQVQDNQQLVLPGGWQQPDYTYLCLYIIRNCGNNRWSFTVCNTGRDGLQYHPASFDPETGRELKQLAMTVWDIPSVRVMDSTFWTLLFRMQVYPSHKNNAAFLYTKLLPALNSRPLLSNLDQGPSEYLEVPDEISAQSYHPLARLALTSSPATGTRSSKYATLLLMNAAVQLAYEEIEHAPASSMDPEDTRILKLTGRNIANFASTIHPNTVGDGTLGASLSDTWDLLDKLLKKLNFSSSKPMDQYSHGLSAAAMTDDFSKGKIVSMRTGAGSAAFPLFGRLRRDNYEEVVKRLMGDPRPDPILIPAVLTDEHLPPVAKDYATAASYLQRVSDACSLLLQQRRLIKNAPAFAASASQHALTTVLPMPNSDPKFCFWRKSEMRRETQLNLLFLIRRLCRIYSAATACVQQSRGLIAIRSTAFAAAACVADAICRAVAVDDPSTFALHYSGLCEGPTEPFAIEAGAYDTLGSNLPIYDPNICSLRYQCLDYLRNLTLKQDGTFRHTIFNFDKSLSPMQGDVILIDQLSIQLAMQRPHPRTEEEMTNHAARLIGGSNGSLIEVLPEFEYFRDIVFHFKHAVSGKDQTPDVPETHTWLPSDATLHWQVKRNEKEKDNPILSYNVTAFRGHDQLFIERIAQQEAKKKTSSFKGFLALFSAKSKIERSRLSSADATTVVNSCGEKFLGKR